MTALALFRLRSRQEILEWPVAAGVDRFAAGAIRDVIPFLERTVSAELSNSRYVHWLGRAYGRRAEEGSVLLAPHFAIKRVRRLKRRSNWIRATPKP